MIASSKSSEYFLTESKSNHMKVLRKGGYLGDVYN